MEDARGERRKRFAEFFPEASYEADVELSFEDIYDALASAREGVRELERLVNEGR